MNTRLSCRNRAIALLKTGFQLCLVVVFGLSSLAAPAWANDPIDAFGTVINAAQPNAYANTPFTNPCGRGDFAACDETPALTDTINVNFGTGNDVILQSITVGGDEFAPAADLVPGGLATEVFFRRSPNAIPGVPPGGRDQLFFQFDGNPAVNPLPQVPAGAPLNIQASEARSLREGMLSLVINRGIDNIFNNDTANAGLNTEETRNNIERVDYIITGGNGPNGGLLVPAAARDRFGFLVMDRGGNDPFRIAAILAVDAAGNPTRYGPLQIQPDVGWGGDPAPTGTVNNNIASVVTRRDDTTVAVPPTESYFRPSHTVEGQQIRGRFFRISNLLAAGAPEEEIFGYSIFADDVVDGPGLTDVGTFPTNTEGNTTGGLDLISGGAVLSLQSDPQIGIAKANSAPRRVAGQPGFFDFDITLRVTNTGGAFLNNVQVTEDLQAALINNATNRADSFTIVGTPTLDASGIRGIAPTINPNYNGNNASATTPDANLFTNAANRLNVGDTAVITLTVRTDLGTNNGGPPPLNDGVLVAQNQAQATGTTALGQTVTDDSQDGGNVDPDGDGNPGNNSQPSPIEIPARTDSGIGLAKTTSVPVPVAGQPGFFDFNIRLRVVNTGITVLNNVRIQEDLQQALITGAANRADAFSIAGAPTIDASGVTGTAPTINPAYNGNTDVELITGNNFFNVGDSAIVTVPVRVELGTNLGGPAPLGDGVLIANNQATTTATTPTGGVVNDLSQDGENVDPDGNGDPTDNNVPTPIQIPSGSEIGVAKTTSAPRPVTGQNGVFDFDIIIRVENTGTTLLNNVQITENLQTTLITNATNRADSFSLAGAPTVNAAQVTSTAPTINPAYNGNTVVTLFNAGSVFNVGDVAIARIPVRVNLGTNIGGPPPLNDGVLIADNQATGTGVSPGGQTVSDLSQSGENVDPDGDGFPTNNNDPNPIRIPFPSIGVAKSLSEIRPIANTTQVEFDFTIRVINTGQVVLQNVNLQDNLQEALITDATNRVDSFILPNPPTLNTAGFTGTAPTLATGYDGVTNLGLFSNAANTFNPGDTATVVVTIRADLGSGGAGPLNDGVVIADNTARASGTPTGPGFPPGALPVSDVSQAGTNVDPDGDGNPENNNQPTQIRFPTTIADFVLVKRITNIFRQGTPLTVPGIANFNDDPNDLQDAIFNTALGGNNRLAGIFQLPSGVVLQPGDEVEYTLYFWNNSGGEIRQLNLCDELQPPSVLNTAVSFQLSPIRPLQAPSFTNAGSTVQGRSPGAPLESFCISAPGAFPLGPPGPSGGLGVGAGGGIVAGPFTVPSNQFGAVRFRIRLP